MRRLLPALLLLSVAGCTTPPVAEGPHPHPGEGRPLPEPLTPGQRAVLDALANGARVAALPAEEQRREIAAAQAAQKRDRTAAAKLRLGVLLALPVKGIDDDAQAVAVLEPLAVSGDAPVRQLASLLLTQVSERIHERRRAEQLKAQVEALKAIERGLIEREGTR